MIGDYISAVCGAGEQIKFVANALSGSSVCLNIIIRDEGRPTELLADDPRASSGVRDRVVLWSLWFDVPTCTCAGSCV